MKCLIGLGNPGAAYAKTRHNVGFMAIDQIAREWGIDVSQKKCKALIGEGNVRGTKVWLIKPQTYMNLSGESLRAFLDYYKIELENITVLYDDLDTPFGKFRLRYQGGAGGHNGIKSIIQHTGTQVFNRIRIGISRPAPGYNIADYVLSPFSKEEFQSLPEVLEQIQKAVKYDLEHTFEQTMAAFNKS
ncbi:aminoacyl-tRNA hydrolase [Paenibacillus senegalensis]|uniref:aminoacyl-tRNA hydrolase n=1 Tax=Paenibacillus senegalensis TaxID=1465766 RepID=UPI0002897593|nr:aminoacyl-tRNA hydrolase [Paenibacillus senegalensis]